MMAALGVLGRAALLVARALARSMSLSAIPAPNAPILMKLRRDRPSQKRCEAPRRFNMFFLSLNEVEQARQAGVAEGGPARGGTGTVSMSNRERLSSQIPPQAAQRRSRACEASG